VISLVMFILIDKPGGITSHDVVDKVRAVTGERRVGHAGTLDPNASGLLIVAVGRESTKKLGEISKNTKKTYEAEIFLGEETMTDDVESSQRQLRISHAVKSVRDDKSAMKSLPLLSKSKVTRVLRSFIGEQMQTPPVYSAIKIKGKKAYELAREGKTPKLKPRKIVIYSIKLLSYGYPILKIDCMVSSGTYIRSLARDIGRNLGCGAYLKNLRRTSIGKFDITKSVKLSALNKENWQSFTSPLTSTS
jgi:tRNA pseudouridine55 synthase